MLLLVTIGLVVIAAVALVIGFVSNQLPPIYISIGCSFVAAIVLALFSRLSRRQAAQATAGAGAPAPLFGVDEAATADTGVLVRAGAAREEASAGAVQPVPVPARSWGDDLFPIGDYDELRVAEILPLLPELDADELEQVRDREEQGRSRATILSRVSQLLASAPDLGTEWAGAAAAGAPASAAVAVAVFPIADYEELKVAEILPLLSQLEPDELDEVAARERSTTNRGTIMNRIGQLQRPTRQTRAVSSPAAPARKASAKKAPAKKAATKATDKKVAPRATAKKAPAKKAPAKKSTAAKKAPAKKTPARAPAKKATAKKAARGTRAR